MILLWNIFDTKYFVLTYSIDVVPTLSYNRGIANHNKNLCIS